MSEWKPIESAPKDGTVVIVFSNTWQGEGPLPVVADYADEGDGGQWWEYQTGTALMDPKWWMEAPAPPATEDA